MAINVQLIKELRDITQAGMMDCKKALEATNGNVEEAVVWLRENGLYKAAKKSDRVAAEGVSFAVENENKAIILEINSETDFVAKNENFLNIVQDIANSLLNSNAKTLEEGLKVTTASGDTIENCLVNATATIGEKIVLRKFEIVDKKDSQIALYNHANKRVSVLLSFDGEISKEDSYNIAMHVAAMAPKYISKEDVPEEIKNEEFQKIKEQAEEDPKLMNKPQNILENILNGKLSKRLSDICLLEQDFVLDENYKVGEFIKSKNSKITKLIRYEVGEGIEKTETDFASEVAAQLGK